MTTVQIGGPDSQATPADLVARWRHVPSAIVADVSKGECLIDPAIRPLKPPGQQPRLFGRAVTARCAPPDFGAVLRALDLVQPGDVLAIDAQGNASHAMIGGILGEFLHRRQAAGIICDGAIRDVRELAATPGFSVYSRSITPRGPVSMNGQHANGEIRLGGRVVNPGDLLIGDDDGLVVLSPASALRLIDLAEAKLALEADWIAALSSGRSVRDVFNLDGQTPAI
jgi:4-hydroxy-4-methyl-2-oxoglutarate aldolase